MPARIDTKRSLPRCFFQPGGLGSTAVWPCPWQDTVSLLWGAWWDHKTPLMENNPSLWQPGVWEMWVLVGRDVLGEQRKGTCCSGWGLRC